MSAQGTPPSPLGSSRVSTIVGVLSAFSLLTYLLSSRAVVLWREQASYLWFVLKSFAQSPKLPTMAFMIPVSVSTAVTSVVSVIAAATAGVLVWRTFREHAVAAPLACVVALSTAVAPVLILATVMWPDGRGHLTAPIIAVSHVLSTVVVAWWCSRQSKSVASAQTTGAGRTAAPQGDDASLNRISVGLLFIAAPFALIVLMAGLSGIHGYDSFSDHLARPARWFVEGRLETGIDGEVVTFYPGNVELLVRWTLALGTDRFAFLVSYSCGVAAVWVVYRLARELGQAHGAASISALAAASLQVLAYQSMVVYSDTFTALCLLLATWLMLIWVRAGSRDRRITVGIGLSLGLALGAKYAAGPPVAVLGLVWLWHAVRDVRRDEVEQPFVDPRWLLPQLVLLAVSILPGAAFWYTRNLVSHGNPLYPLSIAGLPGIKLQGLVNGAPTPHGAWQQLTYPWTETGHLLGFETGLGASVASLAIIALIFLPFRDKSHAGERTLWFIQFFSLLAWVQTGILVPRYGLFPLLLSFVFVGNLLVTFPSLVLRAVATTAISLTMIAVGFQMAGFAAYNTLLERPTVPIPSAIATLPPARILNLAGQPSGYYAMGADYRHRVVTPFAETKPADVPRFHVAYILMPTSREADFARQLRLELVGRFESPIDLPTSLWRIR